MFSFEFGGQFLTTYSSGNGKGADVVLASAIGRCDKIGERIKNVLAFALPLLAEGVESTLLG